MYQSGYVLRNPADFDNAIYFDLRVSVWHIWAFHSILCDHDGSIQCHNERSVTVNGADYDKTSTVFRVR